MSVVTLDAALAAMRAAGCFYARPNLRGKMNLYRKTSTGKFHKVNRAGLEIWLLNNTETCAPFVDRIVAGVLDSKLEGFPTLLYVVYV